jgi:phage/conjugal plasmid C-4 type zinc finger TraR family protein
MDDADRAQRSSESEAERILAAARARNREDRAQGKALPQGRACSDCDDPIDARRLAAKPDARRCTPCQRTAEGGQA